MRSLVQVRVGILAAVLGLGTALVSPGLGESQAATGTDAVRRTGPHQMTLKAGALEMSLDFATGVKIASFTVGGVEKLAGTGAGSVVQLDADGSVLSSTTSEPARVDVSKNQVQAVFTMANEKLAVEETWRFRVHGEAINQHVRRTYHWKVPASANRAIRHSAQPQMVWSTDAWDYIRKPEDGGTVPVGGEKLRAAADARLPASEPATYAPILGEGNTLGQSFTAKQGFMKVGAKIPTYGETTSDTTLSLYAGVPGENLTLLSSKRFLDVVDNSWLYLNLSEEAPAGRYYLEQSDPEGTIAWWTNSSSYDEGGIAYANRQPRATEDRNIRVGDRVGPLAFPDGLALESGGNRYGAEQSNFTFLDRRNELALQVTSTSDDVLGSDHFRRGDVGDPGPLETNWMLSGEPFRYTNGNPKGYVSPSAAHDEAGGHFSTKSSAYIFSPVRVRDGETHSHTLTWRAANWPEYYDLGDLRGIDESLLSGLLNDFGRSIMQDKRIGGSSERSFRSAQAPPFTSIWNIYAAELLQDEAAFDSFRAQMLDMRDGLQADNGFLHCCYPFEPPRTQQPTYDVTDNVVNWPLAVATLYNVAPQRRWLEDIAPAVRDALDYALENLLVTEGPTAGLLSNYQCGQPAPATGCFTDWSEWNDQYRIGQVSAYHNVMAYAALTHWAELEREVLHVDSRSDRYVKAANGIRRTFNRTAEQGGFWSTETETFAYTRDAQGRIAKDCSHLFVNGYALQFDLVGSAERRAQVAASLRAKYDANSWQLHGSNPVSCRTDEPHMYFPFFVDGGVHLVMEQPAAQIGLALDDRSYNVDFARRVVERYGWDNFWGFSNIQPDTMAVRRDVYQEPWMGNNVVGAWPLYHQVYGFQPHHDRLDVVPFIDESLVGSEVDYLWRGRVPVSVRYDDLDTFVVTTDAAPDPVRVGWSHRTPGRSYTVVADGRSFEIVADGDGVVWYRLDGAGTTQLSIRG